MLKYKFYVLVTLAIMIIIITTFILLLMTLYLTLLNHASTQKTNQTFSQKFRTEIYFFTWNWWILNWENCWHMSRSFFIICFKLESTSSYSHWAKFLFYNESSFYFVHQISKHISLYTKKAPAYCAQSWRCEWNQPCYLQNLSFTTLYNELVKSLSRIHSIFYCNWLQCSRQSDLTRQISLKKL